MCGVRFFRGVGGLFKTPTATAPKSVAVQLCHLVEVRCEELADDPLNTFCTFLYIYFVLVWYFYVLFVQFCTSCLSYEQACYLPLYINWYSFSNPNTSGDFRL